MDLAKFRLGEALAIKKKLYPAGHLEVAATEDNLGLVHRYQGLEPILGMHQRPRPILGMHQ